MLPALRDKAHNVAFLIRELWLDENAGDLGAAIPRDRTCSFDIVVARNDPLKTMTAARFVGFGSRIGEAQQFQRGKAGANELCQVYFRPGMSAQVTAAFQRPLDRTPAVNSPRKLRYALSSTSRIRAPSPVSIRSGNGRNVSRANSSAPIIGSRRCESRSDRTSRSLLWAAKAARRAPRPVAATARSITIQEARAGQPVPPRLCTGRAT